MSIEKKFEVGDVVRVLLHEDEIGNPPIRFIGCVGKVVNIYDERDGDIGYEVMFDPVEQDQVLSFNTWSYSENQIELA